jgi:hypothetical protein
MNTLLFNNFSPGIFWGFLNIIHIHKFQLVVRLFKIIIRFICRLTFSYDKLLRLGLGKFRYFLTCKLTCRYIGPVDISVKSASPVKIQTY